MLKKIIELRNYYVFKKFDLLSKMHRKKFPDNPQANFIISISSYPKRIHQVPAVFESLFKQKSFPKKYLLVLTEEEWPNKELPRPIQKLENLGVKIFWVKGNSFAVKNISPVVEAYPNDDILILDDDIIYGPKVVSDLVESDFAQKGYIVGHIAKAIHKRNGSISMWFRNDKPANKTTPSESVFFIGYSGIYYPKNTLDKRVSNFEAIKKIVPGRGKDIWLYCAAIAKNSKQVCLGSENKKGYYIPIPVNDQTKPKEWVTGKPLDDRFFKTVDYFGIRERLLEVLPNQKRSHKTKI
jgi:hypothetical protein